MATPKKDTKTPTKDTKTPTKRSISSIQSPQTPQSPAVDNSIRRRVSDVLVNLHKYVQTWETDNQASFQTANTLCSLYGQWDVIRDEDELKEILSDKCKQKYHMKLIDTREDLLNQLKNHRLKLQELLIKMNGLVENVKVIYYLGLESVNHFDNHISFTCDNKREGESFEEPVIFTSWTAAHFHRTAQLLVSMYAKEYKLKEKFYEIFFSYRVGDSEKEVSVLSKCLSVWLHQPHIDINAKMYLDSMLLEAELK